MMRHARPACKPSSRLPRPPPCTTRCTGEALWQSWVSAYSLLRRPLFPRPNARARAHTHTHTHTHTLPASSTICLPAERLQAEKRLFRGPLGAMPLCIMGSWSWAASMGPVGLPDAGAAEGGAGGNLLLPPSQLQQGQAAGRMALRAPQGRPATLPPASHRRPQQPAKCIYFARGYCQNGDSCRFEHGSPPGPTKQVCARAFPALAQVLFMQVRSVCWAFFWLQSHAGSIQHHCGADWRQSARLPHCVHCASLCQ